MNMGPDSYKMKSHNKKISNFHTFETNVNKVRPTEYSRLTVNELVYLDNAGTPLYSETQVNRYAKHLCSHVYGNPHSANQSSMYSGEVIENIRYRALRWFNADPEEYALIFTSGCTASLKILADCFKPQSESTYNRHTVGNVRDKGREGMFGEEQNGVFCFTEDNHTSAVGMREVFKARNVASVCLSAEDVERLNGTKSEQLYASSHTKSCPPAAQSFTLDNVTRQPVSSHLQTPSKYNSNCSNHSENHALCICLKLKRHVIESTDTCDDNKLERPVEIETSSSCSRSDILSEINQTRNEGLKPENMYVNAAHENARSTTSLNCIADSDKQTEFNLINNLFIYPLQSNFNGQKYPIKWIEGAHAGGLLCWPGQWFVAVDAASYVSTSQLDLASIKPDFVAVSFYKIFGFPTGLGALLVRKSSSYALEKSYFGGGTVEVVIPKRGFHRKRQSLCERFEDGTLPFLEIVALGHSMDFMQNSIGSMDEISSYTFKLARFVFKELEGMRHANGSQVVHLYHSNTFSDPAEQGPIVNFNLLKPDGSFVGFAEVDKIAQLHNVHMRTGCFCNTGACQTHLRMTAQHVLQHYHAGHVCGDAVDLVEGKPTGSCRISFGHYSNLNDALAFLAFIDVNFRHSYTQKGYVHNGEAIFREHFIRLYPDDYCMGSENSETFDLHKTAVSDMLNRNHKIQQKEEISLVSRTEIESNNKIKPETGQSEIDTGHSNISLDLDRPSINHSKVSLSDIFLYPVKSCGAFQVKTWKCGSRGLLFDRKWMVVTENGVCVSQKRQAKLCQIRTKIDLESGKLVLSRTGRDDFAVDLNQMTDDSVQGQLRKDDCLTRVCGDRVRGVDCGEAAAAWLQSVLDQPGVRLLQQPDTSQRTSKMSDGTGEAAGDLSLANQAQYLLINKQSCRHVFPGRDVEDIVSRLRANLVVDAPEAFAEESWAEVSISGHRFLNEGPCTRCQMICLDQTTGERDKDVLSTLTAFRKNKMQLGILLRHVSTSNEGEIVAGDYLTVLSLK